MSYLLVAIIAYFLVGLEVILDKFLLTSKRVSHPSIYAFYVGLMSLFALALFPFGFHLLSFQESFLILLPGIVFAYGILSMFFAVRKSEASRVVPVVGAVTPIVTYFLSVFFLRERLTHFQILGVVVLILGGLLISFEFPLRINKKKFFHGFYYSIAAGVMLAVAFTWFKIFFEKDNFANVFIWTRFGLFLGAASLLLFPFWRKKIFNSFNGFRKPEKENVGTGALFVANKALGGIGSALTNYAIFLGSVTVVNALVSTEYVFILALGLILSVRFPKIFQEEEDFLNVFQKVISIILITLGIILVSLKRL